MSYRCPICESDMEPVRPFANSDYQLQLPRSLRIKRESADEFGGYSDSAEPVYVCWMCECAYPRSACRVNHAKPVGKSAAGGAE